MISSIEPTATPAISPDVAALIDCLNRMSEAQATTAQLQARANEHSANLFKAAVEVAKQLERLSMKVDCMSTDLGNALSDVCRGLSDISGTCGR